MEGNAIELGRFARQTRRRPTQTTNRKEQLVYTVSLIVYMLSSLGYFRLHIRVSVAVNGHFGFCAEKLFFFKH